MPTFITNLFNDDALSPHGLCLTWRPELIWLHVGSDAVIGLAYFSIPIVLAYFAWRRPDVGFNWVFWCFAVFILACGTTHFMSIWTLWVPDYGIEGLVKLLTALASIATALALWPLLPQALAIPSPQQLRGINRDLSRRVEERDAALVALRRESSERERAQEMLRQSQKMEAVGQLTAGIAHDFNNLLTAMMMNLDRSRREIGRDPERAQKAIENATLAAERAAKLTSQLLAFARKVPLQPQATDAAALIDANGEILQNAIGPANRLVVEIAPDLPPLFVDPNQLENALLNLATNARDAMPQAGTVTLSVTKGADGQVELCVADTGTGMKPEVRERAFEPFFTTKPVGEGSGLGLSQVVGFAEQSGGTVSIDSSPGRGTRVCLSLPAAIEVAA